MLQDRDTNQHTPGPWRWNVDPSGHFAYQHETGKIIASVQGKSTNGAAAANARLIAAAPELLAALRAIQREIEANPDNDTAIRSIDFICGAAIAKAEGQS